MPQPSEPKRKTVVVTPGQVRAAQALVSVQRAQGKPVSRQALAVANARRIQRSA